MKCRERRTKNEAQKTRNEAQEMRMRLEKEQGTRKECGTWNKVW